MSDGRLGEQLHSL